MNSVAPISSNRHVEVVQDIVRPEAAVRHLLEAAVPSFLVVPMFHQDHQFAPHLLLDTIRMPPLIPTRTLVLFPERAQHVVEVDESYGNPTRRFSPGV
jgi:hypothetical protein